MKKNKGTATAVAREIFEGKCGIEASARAGNNPQIKGIVHETIVKNAYNSSPKRLFDGTKAVLSKSTTAARDDILIKNGGNIVGRMQLKDTPKSIYNTVNQVKNHHYAGTKLMGTKETVTAYNKIVENAAVKGTKIAQEMKSTGVSSADTSRIAAKTIGSSAGKISAGALGKVAASSGAAGAAISGGIEAISSGIKYANGDIDGKEFAENVAKETAGGGFSAAGGSVAATIASTGTATLLAAVGAASAPAWIPAAVGIGTAVAVGSAIKKGWDYLWN